jgi:hypothetical protein
MKQKKKTDYFQIIKGIIIFRDNVEEILSILTSNGLYISLQDEQNVYDKIEEIKETVGVNLKELKIDARNKETDESVSLSFEKNKLLISCYGSERMYSLGFQLEDYFSRTIPWHYKVFNPYIYQVMNLIFCVVFFIFNKTNGVLAILTLVNLLLLFFSYILRKYAYGIRLVKHHEHGFWKRNKDNIILTIIGAVIGAFFGVIGTLFVQFVS